MGGTSKRAPTLCTAEAQGWGSFNERGDNLKSDGHTSSMVEMRLALAAAALLLTGCASSADGAAATNYASSRSIARALDQGGVACAPFTPNPDMLFVRDAGYCGDGSAEVDIYTFNSSEQQDKVNDAFKAFASGIRIKGDAWQVSVHTEAQAKRVQKILGGEVQ